MSKMKPFVFVVLITLGLFGSVSNVYASSSTWLVPNGLACPGKCVAAAMIGPRVGDGGSVVPPGADRSMGYSPGTSWPTKAFWCPGLQPYQEWDGQDDDHTYSDVIFSSPISISGVVYNTIGGNGANWYVPHHGVFYVSMDGTNYIQVGELSARLPENKWTTVLTTWPATMAKYFRWIMDDNDGTMSGFPVAEQMRFLAPSTTAKAC